MRVLTTHSGGKLTKLHPRCLPELTITGTDLTGADFTRVSIPKLVLSQCDLSGADFTGSFLPRLVIERCDWDVLNPPNFTGCILWGADINASNVPMSKAGIFHNADLSGASIRAVAGRHDNASNQWFETEADIDLSAFKGAFILGTEILVYSHRYDAQRDLLLTLAKTGTRGQAALAKAQRASQAPGLGAKANEHLEREQMFHALPDGAMLPNGRFRSTLRSRIKAGGYTLTNVDKWQMLRNVLGTLAREAAKLGEGVDTSPLPREYVEQADGTVQRRNASRIVDIAQDRYQRLDTRLGRLVPGNPDEPLFGSPAEGTLYTEKSGPLFLFAIMRLISRVLNNEPGAREAAEKMLRHIVDQQLLDEMVKPAPRAASAFRSPPSFAGHFAMIEALVLMALEKLKWNDTRKERDKGYVINAVIPALQHIEYRRGIGSDIMNRNPDKPSYHVFNAAWLPAVFGTGAAAAPVATDLSSFKFAGSLGGVRRSGGAAKVANIEINRVLDQVRVGKQPGKPVVVKNLKLKMVGGPINATGITFRDCVFNEVDLHMWNLTDARFERCSFDNCQIGTRRFVDLKNWYIALDPRAKGKTLAEAIRLGLVPKGYPTTDVKGGGRGGILPHWPVKPVLVKCDLYLARVARVSADDLRGLFDMSQCRMPYMHSAEHKATLKKRGGFSPEARARRAAMLASEGEASGLDASPSEQTNRVSEPSARFGREGERATNSAPATLPDDWW